MRTQADVLQSIGWHPFISREQLALRLQMNKRNLQLHLEHLRAAKWIRRVNGRQSEFPARSLWVLTRAGLAQLAAQAQMPVPAYGRALAHYPARLAWLAIALERVYRVREFVFRLQRSALGWRLLGFQEETALEFYERANAFRVALHGATLWRLPDASEIALVFEVDTFSAPVALQRTRLARLCLAQDDVRFIGFEERNKFPTLVVLAATPERAQEYRRVLLGLGFITGIVPHTFFITPQNLSRFWREPDAAVWETEFDATPVPFLHGVVGARHPLGKLFVISAYPPNTSSGSTFFAPRPLASEKLIRKSRRDIAALALALPPHDKRLLEQVGAHPLLSARELAFETCQTAQSVRRALKRLGAWQLIAAQRAPGATPQSAQYYVLAERGVWFLAARASFGLGVAQFAKFKGWKKRFGELVRHWEHTRLENELFLQLHAYARRQRHTFGWVSELEARLYLDDPAAHVSTRFGARRHRSPRAQVERGEWNDIHLEDDVTRDVLQGNARARALAERGQRLRSFLPDGSGVYETPTHTYYIVLEVDRAKASTRKITQKFSYYAAVIFAQAIANWRILIVTSGWERALNLSWYVFRLAQIGLDGTKADWRREEFIRSLQRDRWERFVNEWMLPVWVTTEAAMKAQGVAAPIWLEAKAWANLNQDPRERKRLDWLAGGAGEPSVQG